MKTATIALLATVLVAALAAPLLTLAAATDNDKNNIRCTGDPHDDKDSGNVYEPPNSAGNPHFCPPIGP